MVPARRACRDGKQLQCKSRMLNTAASELTSMPTGRRGWPISTNRLCKQNLKKTSDFCEKMLIFRIFTKVCNLSQYHESTNQNWMAHCHFDVRNEIPPNCNHTVKFKHKCAQKRQLLIQKSNCCPNRGSTDEAEDPPVHEIISMTLSSSRHATR